jgi:hypothetical protein
MAGAMGPLIGALFNSVTPKAQDKKRAVKPKKNAITKGEGSVTQPAQQHGELASMGEPKPISHAKILKEHARNEKRRATEDWISGRMDTKTHSHVHARANHVLASRQPREFKGTTGERAPGKVKGLY